MKMKWNELPAQAQEDLIDWYNNSDPEDEDLQLLADLYAAGQFRAWDCPDCGDRVYEGTPDDWRMFQGVLQVDYASYPGDYERYASEHVAKQCDSCRSSGFRDETTR